MLVSFGMSGGFPGREGTGWGLRTGTDVENVRRS